MKFGKPLRVKAVVVIAVAGLALTACGSSKKTTTNTTTSGGTAGSGGAGALKIGFFGALTGPNAQLGINIKDGEQLAISQYNGKNPAHPVTIDSFDSQGKAAQANNGATKLIGDKDVAVVGPAFSGESEAADPLFESAQIPYVSASATAVDLAQKGRKFFHRVLADDSLQGPADADYVVKTLGKMSVAVIDDNSAYGAGLATAFAAQVTKDSGHVATTDHLDPNGADYGSTVNKIKASNAEAVFFGGYYDAAGRLIKQLKAAGYSGVFMSGDGSEDARFISDAGGAANANGAYLTCACADETSNPAAASFVSSYKAMFGVNPAIYSAEAFDATNFILAAIQAGNTTAAAINTYLTSGSYTGITKTIKFLPNGNVSGGTIYVYTVKNGAIVQTTTTS